MGADHAHEMTNSARMERFEISGDNLTERMLMVFGIGLIGLGLAGFPRRTQK